MLQFKLRILVSFVFLFDIRLHSYTKFCNNRLKRKLHFNLKGPYSIEMFYFTVGDMREWQDACHRLYRAIGEYQEEIWSYGLCDNDLWVYSGCTCLICKTMIIS